MSRSGNKLGHRDTDPTPSDALTTLNAAKEKYKMVATKAKQSNKKSEQKSADEDPGVSGQEECSGVLYIGWVQLYISLFPV